MTAVAIAKEYLARELSLPNNWGVFKEDAGEVLRSGTNGARARMGEAAGAEVASIFEKRC